MSRRSPPVAGDASLPADLPELLLVLEPTGTRN
jgi:hypothetical protein